MSRVMCEIVKYDLRHKKAKKKERRQDMCMEGTKQNVMVDGWVPEIA